MTSPCAVPAAKRPHSVQDPIELMLAGGETCRTQRGWKPGGILTSPALASNALWPFHANPSFSVTRSDLIT